MFGERRRIAIVEFRFLEQFIDGHLSSRYFNRDAITFDDVLWTEEFEAWQERFAIGGIIDCWFQFVDAVGCQFSSLRIAAMSPKRDIDRFRPVRFFAVDFQALDMRPADFVRDP